MIAKADVFIQNLAPGAVERGDSLSKIFWRSILR